MIKAIVLIILFSILAVTFTATMINVNKSEMVAKQQNTNTRVEPTNTNIYVKTEEKSNTETQPVSVNKKNEKTLNLYSTYDENDLIINYVEVTDCDKNVKDFKIPQISGLKDKDVENKINKDIKERIIEFVNKTFDSKGIKEASGSYLSYQQANFANVISLNYGLNYKIGEISYENKIGLNYELISGERLQIEDIFTDSVGIKDLIRLSLYRFVHQTREENWDYSLPYSVGDPIFDIEENEWYEQRIYTTWNEETRQYDERIEKVPFVHQFEEYEIEKIANKKYSDSDFWFSPTQIYFNFRESSWSNSNGNYERVDGVSRLYFKDFADKVLIYDKFLTQESLFENDDIGRKNIIVCSYESFPKEKQAIFYSDNYFYDYTPFLNQYAYGYRYDEESYSFSETLINNINNKMQEIIDFYKEESEKNKNKAYFLFAYPFKGNGNMSDYDKRIYFGTKLITCDIKDKEMFMNQLFGNIYRYPTLGFYGSLPYNVIDLSKANGEYGNLIIECDSAQMNERCYYYTEDGQEIIGINERKLIQSDLWGMSKDDLNKMYNEIFARHGHDFKSQELKEYFNRFDWYEPIPGKTVSIEELNEIEKQNLIIIQEEIDRFK